MAKIVFALNQSLDGFVDHDHTAFQPHVEADEYINPEISCLREISEETGITVGQVDNLNRGK
ncbi:hypothetical protein AK95_26040 [Paenibacillus sp. LC231]|uniref:NUDIX hydrolase n=1 Tax=Paenibacillus sp. LC231 TaxID=1120679 RepID=UPI0008DC77E3|nr:NUDIX hydrolase [Paenibacillus sp. LC231]OIB00630.1 hypothetical protein AK95_26040 [Paenibacillus sp. LC231]